MKSKTLVILLIVPFIIGLLTFVSIIALENFVYADIVDIKWKYKDEEAFKISNEGYLLEATPVVNNEDLVIGEGNELVWTISNNVIENDNSESKFVAKIEEVKENDGESSNFYLLALNEGECVISCRNEKGTVEKSFNAKIYDKGAITINPVRKGSGFNIDSKRYFGQYDLDYVVASKDASYQKENAGIALDITVYKDENDGMRDNVILKGRSENITYVDQKITINDSINSINEEAFLSLAMEDDRTIEATYRFNIVKDGCNIYSYNDLLMVTNYSSDDGEIPVMQVNLQSLENTYEKNNDKTEYIDVKKESAENTEVFGNFNFETQEFNFKKEYVEIPSTYETAFIDKYNKEMNMNISKNIIAGIYLKNDFYGNGFTINLHELAFPTHGSIDKDTGKLAPDKEKDYFFGPLTYIALGDMEEMPLVKAYGQDNAGLYIAKDGITINDINIRNSNDRNNVYDYLFSGSVIDIGAKNVTIKNSVIGNGRTAVRAFSANDLLIKNCILRNATEFILKLGSNEVNKYDKSKAASNTMLFDEFLNTLASDTQGNIDFESPADAQLAKYLFNRSDPNDTEASRVVKEVQNMLDNTKGLEDKKINVKVEDTYFYSSGIYSIGLDSRFNGYYLYNGRPSEIRRYIERFKLNNVYPSELGGTSYPIYLTLSKDTRFYDWKDIDSIDASCLISENFSKLGVGIEQDSSNIDKYFPMKPILREMANKGGYIYKYYDENDTKEYINRPIAWYGGGYNASQVIIEEENKGEYLDYAEVEVDIADAVIQRKYTSGNELLDLLAKCVIMATGSNPFRFRSNTKILKDNEGEQIKPALFDESPKIEDLKLRAE